MKTLILNGSPRRNGDTAFLVGKIIEQIDGEYRIVNAYNSDISPCSDCRYCRKNKGCLVNDEMQEVYSYIQECDNILIASPLYFSELTGKLLDVGSRLQCFFCARFFRKEEPIPKSKKGAVILVGGGDGQIEKAYGTACTLLRHMNCVHIHEAVYSHKTNERPAAEDETALCGIKSIVNFFHGSS
ncbi:MAG: flavodoxin family protein [Lachnospiraceae bacterium]|nr:flavodoxin family protein [Lachnospiraceae bacterium]